MAASNTDSATGPSSDALASIITQVSPNGQPARAPARPARPVKKKVKATASNKAAAESFSAGQSSAVDEAALPAPVSLPASTSSSTPASAPAASTAQAATHAPASQPQASTSAPQTASTSQTKQQPRTKKKKSPWSSLLAAFGCSSRSQAKHFQDDSQTAPLTSSSRPSTIQTKEMTQTTSESSRIPIGSTSAALGTIPVIAEEESGHAHEMVANNSRLGTQLSKEETGDVMSGAVVPPGAEGTPNSTPRKKRSRLSADSASGASSEEMSDEEEEEEEEEEYLDEQDEEDRIIQNGGMGIPIGEDGLPRPLLSELSPHDKGRKCLVLDLDETLVHSSFKMIHSADYIVPVEIENQNHNVYVIKRPGVDEFLRRMGEIYEVVVFTASLSKYADPVLDQLDIHRVVRHRLFRESCYNHRGNYVKDLSQLGRPIGETIIIDNSPASYIFHPKNAVPVSSWFNDPHDTELTDMVGVLADLADVDDVRSVLDGVLDQ